MDLGAELRAFVQEEGASKSFAIAFYERGFVSALNRIAPECWHWDDVVKTDQVFETGPRGDRTLTKVSVHGDTVGRAAHYKASTFRKWPGVDPQEVLRLLSAKLDATHEASRRFVDDVVTTLAQGRQHFWRDSFVLGPDGVHAGARTVRWDELSRVDRRDYHLALFDNSDHPQPVFVAALRARDEYAHFSEVAQRMFDRSGASHQLFVAPTSGPAKRRRRWLDATEYLMFPEIGEPEPPADLDDLADRMRVEGMRHGLGDDARWFGTDIIRGAGRRLALYEDGIVVGNHTEVIAVTWGDLYYVCLFDRPGATGLQELRAIRRDGETVLGGTLVSAGMGDVVGLTILQLHADHLIRNWLSAHQQGDSFSCGPKTTVSPAGLRHKNRDIAWDRVRDIDFSWTATDPLATVRSDGRRTLRIPLTELRNAAAFAKISGLLTTRGPERVAP
ncbi:hypothetical protein BAY61_22605 [Prauserella marina]|nr:hypothetical protein BAY61_22605 [Prauserella marina]